MPYVRGGLEGAISLSWRNLDDRREEWCGWGDCEITSLFRFLLLSVSSLLSSSSSSLHCVLLVHSLHPYRSLLY